MLETPNYSKPPKKGLRLKAKRLLENSSYSLITKLSLILNLCNCCCNNFSYFDVIFWIRQYKIFIKFKLA